jgi:hypothetical protein
VWGDEDGDDESVDSDNDDSGRLYDFVVAKTNDQEENVAARPGFKVHYLIGRSSSALTSAFLSPEDGLTASCLPTTSAQYSYRPPGPISEAAVWGNYARFHDSRVQTGEEVNREFRSSRSECLADPPPSVSTPWASKHHLDGITFQWG